MESCWFSFQSRRPKELSLISAKELVLVESWQTNYAGRVKANRVEEQKAFWLQCPVMFNAARRFCPWVFTHQRRQAYQWTPTSHAEVNNHSLMLCFVIQFLHRCEQMSPHKDREPMLEKKTNVTKVQLYILTRGVWLVFLTLVRSYSSRNNSKKAL